MKWMKLSNAFLTAALLGALAASGFASAAGNPNEPAADAGHSVYGHSKAGKIGITRTETPGDELVFQVIPTGSETPVDSFYYERVTDKTFVTPGGQTVKLNSLGNVGEEPGVYFAFTQNADQSIYFYGALFANPAVPGTYAMAEWVTDPAQGYTLNYPGSYYVGLEWDSKFQTTSSFGFPMSSVDVHYKVTDEEKVTVPAGTYKALKIVCTHPDGSLDSVSWFAPDLGVNIKRLSNSGFKPGYQLSSYSFAEGGKYPAK